MKVLGADNDAVGVAVRQARSGDGEGLARAALDLAEQHIQLDPERFKIPDIDLVEWHEDELQKPLPENAAWLVAEVDGKVVGEVQVTVQEPLDTAAVQPQRDVASRRAYVNYLAVQAAHQGRGIGTHLMEAAEQWARDSGAELILTDTNLRSERAVRFYEKLGYEKQSIILRKRLA